MFLGIWNNQHFSVYLETVSKFLTEHSDDDIGQRSSHLNPLVPNIPFLYPLKTSRGREMVHWERMG